MKFRDLDGQFKDIVLKTGDTLPVGSVVEYEGSTPPAGWIKQSDGGSVIVSNEEPTTGEEVWFQASGNLFDKNNYNLWNGWINEANNTFTENSKGYLVYIPCSPNTTYIVSREVLETNFKVGVADKTPINQGTLTNVINNPYGNSITITSGANDSYLHIYVHYDSDTNYTLEQILDSLRVEIPKKIHTKTGNGYEEFYNEENLKVVTLWENPDTSTRFAPQNITVPDDGFNRLVCYFRLDITSTYIATSEIISGYNGIASFSDGYDGSIRTRTIQWKSKNTYKINDCYYYLSEMSINNDYMIPIKIVGYKQ